MAFRVGSLCFKSGFGTCDHTCQATGKHQQRSSVHGMTSHVPRLCYTLDSTVIYSRCVHSCILFTVQLQFHLFTASGGRLARARFGVVTDRLEELRSDCYARQTGIISPIESFRTLSMPHAWVLATAGRDCACSDADRGCHRTARPQPRRFVGD